MTQGSTGLSSEAVERFRKAILKYVEELQGEIDMTAEVIGSNSTITGIILVSQVQILNKVHDFVERLKVD